MNALFPHFSGRRRQRSHRRSRYRPGHCFSLRVFSEGLGRTERTRPQINAHGHEARVSQLIGGQAPESGRPQKQCFRPHRTFKPCAIFKAMPMEWSEDAGCGCSPPSVLPASLDSPEALDSHNAAEAANDCGPFSARFNGEIGRHFRARIGGQNLVTSESGLYSEVRNPRRFGVRAAALKQTRGGKGLDAASGPPVPTPSRPLPSLSPANTR